MQISRQIFCYYSVLAKKFPKLATLKFENVDKVVAFDTYQKYGFNDHQLRRIMKQRLNSVLLDKGQNIVNLGELLQKDFGFNDREIRQCVVKYPQILSYNNEQITYWFKLLQDKLQYSKEDFKQLLTVFPYMFIPSFESNLVELYKLFNNYVGLDYKQFGEILLKSPFILEIQQERIRGALKQLYSYNFTTKDIVSLLQTPEWLDIRTSYFKTQMNHIINLVVDPNEYVPLIVNNPQLLFLDPHSMMGSKINIFREFGFSDTQIGQILKSYPELFIRSVATLKLKFKFFENYLKIKCIDHPDFPAMFNYDYWRVIRPRLIITNDPILEVLNLSEQEFIAKYNCEEQYKKLLDDQPNKTHKKEVDIWQRSFHRKIYSYGILQ
ncbi:hypothetical protein pb186bvf_019359 [Paramecium bursaria]